MSEETIKEAATAYIVSATRLTIPPEWGWLKSLSQEEQNTFLQEIINLQFALVYCR